MQEFEDSTIRRFVLGDLDEESRERIEAEAIEDEDLFSRIEAIEDEIIDDYLARELPGSELKSFVESLDALPRRRRTIDLVKALAARTAPSPQLSDAVNVSKRLRFASHARPAIAAGFAAAAITAFIFIQARQDATPENPPVSSRTAVPAMRSALPLATPAQPGPETSSALAARRPITPILVSPTSTVDAVASTSVVTFQLSTGTVPSGAAARTLDLGPTAEAVDLQIVVDDNEFSHYNAELRNPDGKSVSSHRDVSVTTLGGAPVIRLRVPASVLGDGMHELVLAGVHERGVEEVAYITFDVRRR